ncbi:hypothetical protein NQ317_011313 [Molorchus minor]|uniref:Medium-chain acyl-CoA ligase ACSF2, mitochondrial n=1 Tax=Molorchus minor TaxID=1323400 RepID=A0ABQ9IZL1_9CUCU|nr:hypothetical protein NQ317_011313 [Molorchus minor]
MSLKVYTGLLVLRKPIKLRRTAETFTLGLLLEQTVKTHGNYDAIVSSHQNKKMTYSEVLDQVDRLAAGFLRIGYQIGDKVGLWAPNLIEWYIANLACARAGCVMVAINPAYQPKEIEYCINKVGINAIICGHKFKTQNYYEFLNSICPELAQSDPGNLRSRSLPSLRSVVTIADEDLSGTHNYNEVLNMANAELIHRIRSHQRDIKIDDPCNIQFTSGTTGMPKAAVISHFHLVNNGFFVGKRNELDKKHHKICVQVPLFHAFGTIITISASLNYGSTLVLPSAGFDPQRSLDVLKEERCTIIHGTPTMYVDLVNAQKERREKINAEIAISGGALCSSYLFKEMINFLGLRKVKSVYGLSETTAVVFQSLHDDDEYKSTCTVGYLQEHVEVKVVDKDNNIVPIGTAGELCVRAYGNMLGYWNDDEKTKEMIGADRWLKTGDQFILEENGYGRVVGRLKEMIIRGGENIFPKEIEDLLNTHPNIVETYVIGLQHERLGEEVCACIRIKENCTVTIEEIKKYCSGNIAHFKIPSVLKIVDGFPKTTSGKNSEV